MTEPLTQATREEARRGTELACLALGRLADSWIDAADRVLTAWRARYDVALGYGSWAEYTDAELEPAKALPTPVRRSFVAYLSDAGMSTRAIAPAVGVSNKTVSLDRREVLPDVTPEPEPMPEPAGATIATTSGVVIAQVQHVELDDEPAEPEPEPTPVPEPEPRKVTGLDGKTYTAPTPKESKPRRKPLPEMFRTQSVNLDRVAEQMTRLTTDDRWTRNKADIAARYGDDLRRAIEALQAVYRELSN